MAQQISRRSRSDTKQVHRKISTNKPHTGTKKINKLSSIIIVCIAVLAIGAIISGSIFIYNKDRNTVIVEGVTIAGINVSGMTKTEAIQAVSDATVDTFANTPMTVKVLDSEIKIDPKSAKPQLDVRSAVNAALSQNSPGPVDLSAYLSLDEAAVRKALEVLHAKYNTSLVQTKAHVAGTAPNLTLEVTVGVPGYGIDIDKLYQRVLSAYRSNRFSVEGECGQVEPSPLDLKPYWDQYHVDAIDATFDPKTFAVNESSDGYTFDIAQAEKLIKEAAHGTKVVIPFVAVKPKVSTEDLQGVLFRDVLSSWVADRGKDDANTNTNLRLACEAINGKIIYPGEVFSYNETLGRRTADRGYRPGPVIINGQMTTSIGGGICQVSSALYYCTMVADLEILERDSHGFLPVYVPKGMDAAISWGYLDFCFKNNGNYPIRIEAFADGPKVTVKLIGTDDKDYYVKMEYVEDQSQIKLPNITYKELPADNPDGYKDGDYIIEPHTGCYIGTYRCKYSKDTNELISREWEAGSRYNKCDGVICKIVDENTPPDNTDPPLPGIGNGFVTEDGELD